MADNANPRAHIDASPLARAVDLLMKHALKLEGEIVVLRTQLERLTLVIKSVGDLPSGANTTESDHHHG